MLSDLPKQERQGTHGSNKSGGIIGLDIEHKFFFFWISFKFNELKRRNLQKHEKKKFFFFDSKHIWKFYNDFQPNLVFVSISPHCKTHVEGKKKEENFNISSAGRNDKYRQTFSLPLPLIPQENKEISEREPKKD